MGPFKFEKEVQWFGKSWGAPICGRCEQTMPPHPSEICLRCGEPFAPGEHGVFIIPGEMLGLEFMSHFHVDCCLKEFGEYADNFAVWSWLLQPAGPAPEQN